MLSFLQFYEGSQKEEMKKCVSDTRPGCRPSAPPGVSGASAESPPSFWTLDQNRSRSHLLEHWKYNGEIHVYSIAFSKICNIIIKWIFVFVPPVCPVYTFLRQQLWCVLLVYGMDKVLTLSFFRLMHLPLRTSSKCEDIPTRLTDWYETNHTAMRFDIKI